MINQLSIALQAAPKMRLFCGIATPDWIARIEKQEQAEAERALQIQKAKELTKKKGNPVTDEIKQCFIEYYNAGMPMQEIGAIIKKNSNQIADIKRRFIAEGLIEERGNILKGIKK